MTDLTRKRGDTYADEWIIRSKKTGLPVDITGYTFVLTMDSRKEPSDSTTRIYQLPGTIVDAAGGRVEFAPSELQSNQIGQFYYDAKLIDGQSRKRTFDEGKYLYTQGKA